MVIAVDTRGTEEYQHFIFETFKKITAQQPQHSFIFIFDIEVDLSFIFSENIIPEVVKPTKISLLPQLKISSLLKKYKADVLVTGEAIKTKALQCLIAFDTTTKSSLKRATNIIAFSESSKKALIEKYKIDPDKIDFIYKGVDKIFQPIVFEQKEKIKEQYAGGNEFFLSTATTESDNLLNLLKAFSVFKKRQKSNMQLLIASEAVMSKEFSEMLRLYKFKNEVKVLENISKNELAGITGAAYAFIYPIRNAEYSPVLQSLKCNVPVIADKNGEIQEVTDDTVLYINSTNHNDIADKMMLIYKDENVRKQLIEKGREQVRKYSWNNSAEMLWKSIKKAGGRKLKF